MSALKRQISTELPTGVFMSAVSSSLMILTPETKRNKKRNSQLKKMIISFKIYEQPRVI
jgi:hypothetical protein